MPTNNIQQNPGMSEPTDLSAIDNISPVIKGGYGGPHAVFDKDHYKAQMRLPGRLIEYNAAQGQITGVAGYVWAINLLCYFDNNVTNSMALPPTELAIKKFMDEQMQILIEDYKPRLFYFPATGHTIPADEFDGTY